MAGNAANTALWAGADVYIGAEGTAGPTDLVTAWGAAWSPAGLLDGAEGFTEARESESTEHYAWGGILYKRSASQHKRTFRFVALEDNAVTFRLVNPGSERETDSFGNRVSAIKTPTIGERFAVGFETREGSKVKRRFARHAEVSEIAEIKESEEEPTVYDITVIVYPESDGTLYRTIEADPDFTPVTPDPTDTEAFPEAPEFDGTDVVIPEIEGVQYVDSLGDELTGLITVEPGDSLNVTASPLPGYFIAEGTTTQWTFTNEDTGE